MPTISLCMIVYNEENRIRRCLESVRGFVDEIIVADTGSTDRTKSICEEYGARIFEYPWAEDFAEVRNHSISKASCDWILLLDADEELLISDPAGLKHYLQNTAYDLIPVCMTHFYGGKPADEKRSYFSCALRLARNDSFVRFSGVIHEKIDTVGKGIGQAADARRFIRILHYGYMEDALRDKQDRNLLLLSKEKDRQPADPWISYHLAAEYYRTGKPEDAYRKVNEAIIFFLGQQTKPPSLVYKLKYDMIAALRHKAAYNGIEQAIALYPDYVDLYFYKGLLQYRQGEYEKARDAFRYCLILGETNMRYLILSGSGSFLPLYYIGLCHEMQGQAEQASEAFRQAEILCPGIGATGVRFENPDETFSGVTEPQEGLTPIY